jgi:tripartite-type tricarboxylate transporter receptor subunit TctC
VVDSVNRAVNAALADPALRGRFTALGAMPMPGAPADFARLLATETDKWARVIRAGKIRPT